MNDRSEQKQPLEDPMAANKKQRDGEAVGDPPPKNPPGDLPPGDLPPHGPPPHRP